MFSQLASMLFSRMIFNGEMFQQASPVNLPGDVADLNYLLLWEINLLSGQLLIILVS